MYTYMYIYMQIHVHVCKYIFTCINVITIAHDKPEKVLFTKVLSILAFKEGVRIPIEFLI